MDLVQLLLIGVDEATVLVVLFVGLGDLVDEKLELHTLLTELFLQFDVKTVDTSEISLEGDLLGHDDGTLELQLFNFILFVVDLLVLRLDEVLVGLRLNEHIVQLRRGLIEYLLVLLELAALLGQLLILTSELNILLVDVLEALFG